MLRIKVPAFHGWDYKNEEFIDWNGAELCLEHSLISISKWETKWCKPFLNTKLTMDELLDYIRCMTITQNVSPETYTYLSDENFKEISDYLESPMSATTISETKEGQSKNKNRIVTSEVIYAKMVSYGIPFECQKWPLNRLIMLIRILDIANEPKKKMSKSDIIARNAELNAARRKKLGTTG